MLCRRINLLICQPYLKGLRFGYLVQSSTLIAVFDLATVVWQASLKFNVYELTEHGVRVLFFFFFFPQFCRTNKLGYLLVKSNRGDCF